jgi:predicted RNase H-like HicB family nuclease
MTSVDEVMARQYTFVAKADLEDGGWIVMFPDLPGVMTQAEAWEDIAAMARDALSAWVEAQLEDGRPIPEPGDYPLPEWNWDEAGAPLITTVDAAKQLDVSPRRVRALAKTRGVGQRYGRSLLFTQDDIERMRPGLPGRPRTSSAHRTP